ncbi:hypothetical protein ACE10Z_23655 [Bradyrhizobium sp. Pha-3]|uniref:hypothetical protein n=1 Tax=Bradyrhizobium sp. Pha-3 TaxID=208375 RepID=UPI0035D4197B
MTTVWTHMGNVQKWDITPNPTILKHKNTQGGLKRVDMTAMTLLEMGFSTALDEWTVDNMMIALLGTVNTAGLIEIGVTSITRQIKWVGANIYGPQWEVILPKVFIAAKEAIQFMSQSDTETSQLPLSGDVLYDQTLGSFGTAQPLGTATGGAPIALTPNELNYYLGTGSVYSAPVGT